MPASYVWYFSPVDSNGMVTAHDALVTKVYPATNCRDLRYWVAGQEFSALNVPHADHDCVGNSWRSKAEAGPEIVDGGMWSFR